jgi:hypothetical protein
MDEVATATVRDAAPARTPARQPVGVGS